MSTRICEAAVYKDILHISGHSHLQDQSAMKVIFVLAAVIVAGKFNRACILIIIFSDSENMIKGRDRWKLMPIDNFGN